MNRRALFLLLLLPLAAPAVASTSTVGSASFLLGATHDHRNGGPTQFGGVAILAAEFSPFLALGPEVGFFRPRENSTVVLAGLSARAEPGWSGVRPYATAGLGVYFWDDDQRGGANYIGGYVGAGARWPARARPLALRLDVRLHLQLQRLGFNDRYDFMTFLLGIQRSW